MAKKQKDYDTSLRDGMIVRFVRQGKSYAQIARMPAVELSAGRIAEIINTHPDYNNIVTDRNKARLRQMADEAFENYEPIKNEKKKRLTAEKLRKLTIGQLHKEDQLIFQKVAKAVEIGE